MRIVSRRSLFSGFLAISFTSIFDVFAKSPQKRSGQKIRQVHDFYERIRKKELSPLYWNKNVNPFGLPVGIDRVINDYSLGQLDHIGHRLSEDNLIKKIAKKQGVSFKNVVLGAGSRNIIREIIFKHKFLNPNSRFVSWVPEYSAPRNYAKEIGMPVEEVVINVKDRSASLETLLSRTRKGDLVYFSNPQLPTEQVLSHTEILKSIKSRPDLFFIIDECYFDYLSGEAKSLVSYINEYKNIFVTKTFSKAFGLKALRVGYAITSELLREKYKLMGRNLRPTSELSNRCATFTLLDKTHLEKSRKCCRRIRNIFKKEFSSWEIKESSLNFIFMTKKIKNGIKANQVNDYINRANYKYKLDVYQIESDSISLSVCMPLEENVANKVKHLKWILSELRIEEIT